MGRGGGGGGGSFHSSGHSSHSGGFHSSGSRSSGSSSRSSGFSGGGRSGGSFSGGGGRSSYSGGGSYRPSSGSGYRPSSVFRPTYAPGVVVVNNNSHNKYGNGGGGGNYNGNGNNSGSGNNNQGCGGCLKIILIAILVFLVMSLIGTIIMNGNKNDVVRTKLENGKVNSSAGYYFDDNFYEDINGKTLEKGLKDFYEKTGVKPYLFLTSSVDIADSFDTITDVAQAAYEQFLGKENGGHIVLAWYETEDEDYYADFWIGSQAQEVMDDDAINVLQRYIVKCYDDQSSYPTYSDLFSAAFSKAADDIMADNTSTGAGIAVEVFLILLVGAGLFILIRKEKKLEQDKIDAQILNAPLQTFGDTEAAAAAKKYETPGADSAAQSYYDNTVSPAAKSYADSASNGTGYSYTVNSGQTETDDSLKTFADTEAEELAKKYESQD